MKTRLLSFASVLSALVLVSFFASPAFGAPGDLDTSFDGDGKVTTHMGGTDYGDEVAVQPNGKIVVEGSTDSWNFATARYNADGSLDTTFDVDGKVATDLGFVDETSALALQPDGKIVVAGYSGGDFGLVRYNADGSLDTTFDGDGKVRTDMGGPHDQAYGLAAQPDGKIVAAGAAGTYPAMDIAVARYNTDGSLDTTFDGDGKVLTPVAPGLDAVSSVTVQPDWKILAAGETAADFVLVRYNTDGSLDTSFDADGILTTDFSGTTDRAKDLVLQPDGRIVAFGHSVGSNWDFAAARYNTDGSLDTTFDGDGKVRTDFGGGDDTGSGVALQADGKIVGAGQSRNGGDWDFGLARYNVDGSLDTSFDTDGKLWTDISGGTDRAEDVALQPDEKIVVAGRAVVGGNYDWALARYLPDDCTIRGTPGNDVLTGTAGDDIICGLGGGDNLSGLGGSDVIRGGPGNDRLIGGAGDDEIDGGTGNKDAAWFRDATGGVTVDLAAGTAAGPGVGSDVITFAAGKSTVENVVASHYGDTITGDAQNNRIEGGKGPDTIVGGSGADVLMGGYNSDDLNAVDGAPDDTMVGGNRPLRAVDTCTGDPGDTEIGFP